MNITLQNLNKNIRGNHLIVNKRALKSLAHRVLQSEEADFDVEITLVDDSYIKKLNKKYRNVDTPTDVLSFLICVPPDKKTADIYISLDKAKEQCTRAPEHQSTRAPDEFETEVAHLLIHGILHLLGYEHGQEMRKKEEHYLSKIK